jgi:hypothetical protein
MKLKYMFKDVTWTEWGGKHSYVSRSTILRDSLSLSLNISALFCFECCLCAFAFYIIYEVVYTFFNCL